jgi:predicted glutamine amidotransferase
MGEKRNYPAKGWGACKNSEMKKFLNIEDTFISGITHIRRTSSGLKTLPKKDASNEDWAKWVETQNKHAHPFVHDNLILAHNGTLHFGDKHDVEMDTRYFSIKFSEFLNEYDELDENKVFEALKKTFELVERGYASLLFYVKINSEWVPFVYKGNKNLYIVENEVVGFILITEPDFIKPYIRVYNSLSTDPKDVWENPEMLNTGLHNLNTGALISSELLIKNYKSKAVKPFQKSTKKSKTTSKSSDKIDKWFEEAAKEVVDGESKLYQVTVWIPYHLSQKACYKLMDVEDVTPILDIIWDGIQENKPTSEIKSEVEELL